MSRKTWQERLVALAAEAGTEADWVDLTARRLAVLGEMLAACPEGESDPLAGQDPAVIRAAVTVAEECIAVLRDQSTRLAALAHQHGTSLRELAGLLGVSSPQTVLDRITARQARRLAGGEVSR